MTISRVAKDEPWRARNGCLSLVFRLAVLAVILGAVLYAVLYWEWSHGSGGFSH